MQLCKKRQPPPSSHASAPFDLFNSSICRRHFARLLSFSDSVWKCLLKSSRVQRGRSWSFMASGPLRYFLYWPWKALGGSLVSVVQGEPLLSEALDQKELSKRPSEPEGDSKRFHLLLSNYSQAASEVSSAAEVEVVQKEGILRGRICPVRCLLVVSSLIWGFSSSCL